MMHGDGLSCLAHAATEFKNMSHCLLPLGSKFFQLTTLSMALALAGCGGGDGTDTIAPKPDTGVIDNGEGNGNGGGETPDPAGDFFLQELIVNPSNIVLAEQPTTFTVTVKAIQKDTSSAAIGQDVQLKVVSPDNLGAITIEGASIATTNEIGEATYELKLNPQAIKNRTVLLQNGFTLTASAPKSDGTTVTQVKTVPVFEEGSSNPVESKLSITPSLTTSSVSNGVLNPFGDNAVFNIAVKNEQGALVPDVDVGLGIADLKGVSITPANQTTDANGMASFNITIDDSLSLTERETLLKGIPYVIVIEESDGATKRIDNMLSVALPSSDYELSVVGGSEQLNAYGDTQQLTITASAINNRVPTQITGAQADITLNSAPDGVSLTSNRLILDANGKASVALKISSTLDATTREKLANEGISYTVILSEPNRSTTTKTFKSSVYVPQQQYKLSFDSADKKQLSSSGGSTTISFRVNNLSGGIIADQEVTAKLPSSLVTAGLLTLENDSIQITDSKGIVSYNVRVPKNLTESQKLKLENVAEFLLTANITEPSGVTSEVSSEAIRIGSDIGQSDIALSAKSDPTNISILDDSFVLQVLGRRADGSAASNRAVKLVIDSIPGVTIVGNNQTTNSAGIASFTINISQNMTVAQRDKLINSGVNYTAVLTDEDGTQSRINQTVEISQPAAGTVTTKVALPEKSVAEVLGEIVTPYLCALLLSFVVTV